MKHVYFILFIPFLISSCKKKKEEEEAPKDPAPVIELLSITPTNLLQFKDSVLIRIKYTDYDGDIGDVDPDEYSLSVKDSRLDEADMYHVQPLAPTGSSIEYEGEIEVKINTMFLLGNGAKEFTTLSIKLKDQAGHWSNEVSAPPIAINDSI